MNSAGDKTMRVLGKAHFYLGTFINGRVYIYTALGIFRTASDAADRCSERGAIIFRQFDVHERHGSRPYGLTEYEAVAACLGR